MTKLLFHIIGNSKHYPGKVTGFGENESVRVTVMKPTFPSCWRWPDEPE